MRALLVLLALLTGCSALIADIARGDHLGVLDEGITRAVVEDEFGRPKSTRAIEGGTEAVYVIRLAGNSSAENADTVLRSGRVFFAGAGHADHPAALLVASVLAVTAMVGTDLVLSVREVAQLRKRKRRVTVLYDADGRVTGSSLGSR